ncbi:hypothetical protein MHYP_G00198410 [Metynnis hypsauchen]
MTRSTSPTRLDREKAGTGDGELSRRNRATLPQLRRRNLSIAAFNSHPSTATHSTDTKPQHSHEGSKRGNYRPRVRIYYCWTQAASRCPVPGRSGMLREETRRALRPILLAWRHSQQREANYTTVCALS